MTLKTLFVPAHLANRTAHYLREIVDHHHRSGDARCVCDQHRR